MLAASRTPVFSVRDLVRTRTSENGEVPLALVQRDEKWDPVRMRHLLDSMLAGYPIGAILFCCVKEESDVFERASGLREARPNEWQLLDGQQRINAFFSMLTDCGSYGRFYLHMTMTREAPGPAQRRKTKDRLLKYIAWRETAESEVEDRELHIDLSRWTEWADSHGADLTISTDNVGELLRQLDPEFTPHLAPSACPAASSRLKSLWRAWTVPTVPVLYAEVDSPSDVLEIFIRVNLGGVDVVGTDVFFAAVKTYWSDAANRLDEVLLTTPFLKDRMAALRFLSRLASRGISTNDLIPLKVDRLAGPKPHPLITALKELTSDNSAVLQRVGAFSTWYQDASRLGYALKLVHPDLWDEVLGWAATSTDTAEDWYSTSLELIDSYLLGGTLFRYPGVLRDPQKNAALLEALTAGSTSEPFPLDQILAVARRNGLRGSGSSTVATLQKAEDRQVQPWNDGSLLTAMAQRIPFNPDHKFDWDHLFPQAQSNRMWVPGMKRREHHPLRPYVNSAGNFWALNFSANRSLQDLPGREKFDRLSRWAEGKDGHEVWPRERWSLTQDEINTHIEVDTLLDDHPDHVDEAMKKFESVVSGRTRRLWAEALERFPRVRDFAFDSDINAHNSSPAELFWSRLGISQPVATPRKTSPLGDHTSNLGPAWEGRERWPNWILDEIAKAAKVSNARNARTKPRDGFMKGWWISTGSPARGTQLGVGLAPDRTSDPISPLWAQVNSRTEGWETVEARILSSELGRIAVVDVDPEDPTAKAIWVPLDTPADMSTYSETKERVLTSLLQVRDVISGDRDPY